MTRNYNDYSIRVEKVETDLGTGFRAEFFIPKTDGTKSNVWVYETYKRGLRPGEVVEQVERIIDLGL